MSYAERSPNTTPVDDPRFLLAVSKVHDALNAAERKHPRYDFTTLRKVAIIVEEAGEALQASLDMLEDMESGRYNVLNADFIDAIHHEVAQCGAMCVRFLMEGVE